MSTYSGLTTVRYFTALDPYYYTVDNRPLKDLRTNIEQVARSSDAALDGEKNVAAALGFMARGYALRAGVETEVMVGEHYLDTMNWCLDHAFLIQQAPVSGTDARAIPKLGLVVDDVSMPLTGATLAGNYRLWTIDAILAPASATSPFYDATNPAYATVTPFEVGGVTLAVTNDGDYLDSNPGQVPTAPAPGYVRVAIVRVPYGTATLTPNMTTFVSFKEDGAAFGAGGGGQYELNIDARVVGTSPNIVIGGGSTVINAISIDAEFAMVYINGVFQTGYEIIDADSIRIPRELPNDTKIALVSTAGGAYTSGRIREDYRSVPAGTQVFTQLQVNADFASLYIGGVYQGRDTYTIDSNSQVTLNAPLSGASEVFFVERSAGIAEAVYNVPSGGLPGEVLTKISSADHDFDWAAPAPGGGSTLPVADAVADLGKVLTFVGTDLAMEPIYEWRTVSGGSSASGFLHQTAVISGAPTNTVVATHDPATALIFVDGAFQGKAGGAFNLTGNSIEFNTPLPIGSEVDIVFLGTSDSTFLQKEMASLALANAQSAAHKPNIPVRNAINVGGGIFVAGSMSSGELAISTDYGRTWVNSTPANLPDGIGGVAYSFGAVSPRLVAVGEAGKIAYSSNLGVSWTTAFTSATSLCFNNVIYHEASGHFVAVGTQGMLAYSIDNGTTWTEYQVDANLAIQDIVSFDDTAAGQWVLVGINGAAAPVAHMYHSSAAPSANTWTAIADTYLGSSTGYVKVATSGATWVACGQNGNIVYSVNPGTATSWAMTYTLVGSSECNGAGYFDGVFVVFGDNNIAAMSIDFGSTWDEYVVGNGDSNEVYTTLLTDKTNGIILGGYDTARCFSKIRRA